LIVSTERSYGSYGDVLCRSDYTWGNSFANLLHTAVPKPVHSGLRPDPDGAARILVEIVDLRGREAVIAQ
jgi:hypothetical protein